MRPLTRARKSVHNARKAIGRLGALEPEAIFVGRQGSLRRARSKKADLDAEAARLKTKIAGLDARYATAEHGLWGTRRIRMKLIGWRQDRAIKKKGKIQKKAATSKELVQQLESAFKASHKAKSEGLKAAKTQAVAVMKLHLQQIAHQAGQVSNQMQSTVNALEAANRRRAAANQLPGALLTALRAKILAEATNPTEEKAFRLVQINKGMEKLGRLLEQGTRTDAETEINRLIGFNKNPPA